MKANYNSLPTEHPSYSLRHQRIAERAYIIWLDSGQPDGCHHDHWLQAERQLRRLSRGPEEASLGSRLARWGDPFGTDIERALDALVPAAAPRSVTSL